MSWHRVGVNIAWMLNEKRIQFWEPHKAFPHMWLENPILALEENPISGRNCTHGTTFRALLGFSRGLHVMFFEMALASQGTLPRKTSKWALASCQVIASLMLYSLQRHFYVSEQFPPPPRSASSITLKPILQVRSRRSWVEIWFSVLLNTLLNLCIPLCPG